MGLRTLVVPVKPLAHIVTNHASRDRHKKVVEYIHSSHLLPVARNREGPQAHYTKIRQYSQDTDAVEFFAGDSGVEKCQYLIYNNNVYCPQEEAALKRKKSAITLLRPDPRWDALAVVLFSVLLFFAMHLWTEWAAVWFAGIALVLCIGRTPWRLARERFCVPVLGFLAFMVVYGLSAIYSPFGGTAAREFGWILSAFAVAALVLFRFEKKHVRGLLWGLAVISALVSLLSTDMACEGPLYGGFFSMTERLGVSAMYDEIEDTVGRVNGLYNDANVTGSLFALGALISLYLVQTGKKWWERLLACLLVSTSAIGILLSVSRGAMLCFGLSLLAWLAAAGKGERLRLFLLMVVSAGVCLAASMPASESVVSGATLPVMLSVASGGVIFLLDWAVNDRLAKLLSGHWKAISITAGAIAIVVLVFVVAAFRLTEPYVLESESDILYRGIPLAAGEYSISADWESGGERRIYIYSRSEVEALMYASTTLYRGPVEDAVFIVPEDSVRVYFQFSGSTGDVIRSVALSDGTEIPMDYRLLPRTLARRLQEGLFSDNSYLLRVQFMKDAWILFKQAPLIGHGLGSSDNLYPVVQPFYYQSRYVHNHVLQVMADQGLLGTIPFLVFLCGLLWLLVKRVKREPDPLAAVLVACWVMMNSHGMMEINFSLPSYQCFAFVLLLLPVVLYGEPLAEKAVKLGGAAVCAVFWLFLAVFGGLMGLRQEVQHESDTLRATSFDQLMTALDSYARRDFFDPDPYRLDYVYTALQDTEGLYGGRMLEYVDKIRKSGNYPANSALLEYYYLPVRDFQGLFDCSKECLIQRTSYAEAWNGQVELYRDKVLPAAGEAQVDVVLNGVLEFRDLLEEVNQDRMEEIVLTESNQAFVDLAAAAVDQGLTGGELYTYLTTGGETETLPS